MFSVFSIWLGLWHHQPTQATRVHYLATTFRINSSSVGLGVLSPKKKNNPSHKEQHPSKQCKEEEIISTISASHHTLHFILIRFLL
jgi:hypothetical protein